MRIVRQNKRRYFGSVRRVGFRLKKHFYFLKVGRVAALTENPPSVFPTDLPFLLLFDQEK